MREGKRYKIVTLGCRTNQYESASYQSQLESVGYRQVEDEEADLCIVNTCTVTASADQRSLYQIRQLLKKHPKSWIYVTGCLAERGLKEIESLSERVVVVPNGEKESLVEKALPEESLPEFSLLQFEGHTRAFIKVQDGCNSFCSYCIIPYVRGRSRSRSIDSIQREVKGLVEKGFKEFVLTGINIGDYDGGDGTKRLSDLVTVVDDIEGVERLRLSSIDPDEVDEDLLKAITKGKNTAPSLHLVLQSGSNAVLKRMNRKYTRVHFFEAVERLRGATSDFGLTTDVIVGFPGETERDFQETLDVIEEVKFSHVHMFPFSLREKTRAARFQDFVPNEVIEERRQRLLKKAKEVAFSLRERWVKRESNVLLESLSEKQPDYFTGHSENFLPFLVKKKQGMRPNEMVKVKATENRDEGLIGHSI